NPKNAARRKRTCTLGSRMAFGVTCPTCGKAFSVTDEIYERKVKGRVVTIKCKQCQAGIRVDATKPGDTKITAAAKGAAAEDKSTETKPAMPAVPQMQAAVQAKPPAPPPPAPVPRRQATLIGVASPVIAPPPAAQKPAPPLPPPPLPASPAP